MPLNPLTNFKIQRYYQNGAQLSLKKKYKFNGVYSRNNLPKIKDWEYVINPDVYKSMGTHWIAVYVNNFNNRPYFDSFGVEYIKKKIKNL